MVISNSAASTSTPSGALVSATDLKAAPQRPYLLHHLATLVPRLLAAALLLSLPVAAQSPGLPTPTPGLDHGQASSRFPMQPPDDPPGGPHFEERRIRALNQSRHKAMVDDAARLLELAKQLNDDAGNLSPADRLHKAAEIEKLAKSVRDKMSYSLGNEPHPSIFTPVAP